MADIFDPEFRQQFEDLQSGDLSETMKWWTPLDRKQFYERLVGVIENAAHLRTEKNPEIKAVGEQMTARLLAEIITIAMRNKDQKVAEMIPRITGLNISLKVDDEFWGKNDAAQGLKKCCQQQLEAINAFRSSSQDLVSSGQQDENLFTTTIRDIFKQS